MTAKDNLRIVQEYLSEFNPALIEEDAVLIDHSQPDPIRGPDGIGAHMYEMYQVVFPGARAEVTRISPGEDTVTLEFTFSGKNDGPFMGSPATGREVAVPMCAVYVIAHGKIAEISLYYDFATMERQLGRERTGTSH